MAARVSAHYDGKTENSAQQGGKTGNSTQHGGSSQSLFIPDCPLYSDEKIFNQLQSLKDIPRKFSYPPYCKWPWYNAEAISMAQSTTRNCGVQAISLSSRIHSICGTPLILHPMRWECFQLSFFVKNLWQKFMFVSDEIALLVYGYLTMAQNLVIIWRSDKRSPLNYGTSMNTFHDPPKYYWPQNSSKPALTCQ